MVKKFCVNCGKEMMIEEGSRITLCEDCRDEKRKAALEKAHQKAKERREEFGIVVIRVYDTTRKKLKAMAREQNKTMADVLKEIVE